jgi:Tol biopolymer transport system component/DNA-binding winged helix-turn-helix (wHTH) protein
MSNRTNGLYEFGSFRLDAAKRLLTRDGESVTLAPKTFDLLLLLAESEGRALTKAELMQALWPDTFVEEANLSFQMSALRRALGEEGSEWIETVPRHGYRFTAAVTKVESDDSSWFRRLAPWVVAAVATLVALIMVWVVLRAHPAPPAEPVSFYVHPLTKTIQSFALSPDGRYLVIAAGEGTKQPLWVRALDTAEPRPLPGTEDARDPFWSRDSRFIAFFADGKLKKIAATGGPPQNIGNVTNGRFGGGTWSRDGVILFSVGAGSPLYRVSAAGGMPVPATSTEASVGSYHDYPSFLPDGRHFLFMEAGGRPHLGSLDSKDIRPLPGLPAYAVFLPSLRDGEGHLFFGRDGALMAQRFDTRRLQPLGEMLQIATGVRGRWGADFSVSASGALAYRTAVLNRLTWFDRQGQRLESVGEPGALQVGFRLSPDQKRVAVQGGGDGVDVDVWVVDLEHGTSSRLTFTPGLDNWPVWSPDGGRVAHRGVREGRPGIYLTDTGGASKDELLLETGSHLYPQDWSPDGRFLVYLVSNPKTGFDLWLVPLAPPRQPIPLAQTEFSERYAQFSPDGRWIAYTSDETGRTELYLQTLPPSGARWQVTTSGGDSPRWRRDGKELFYLAPDGRLMAMAVSGSSTFQASPPQPLFLATIPSGNPGPSYDVSADGKRFLMSVPARDAAETPITVVTNWQAGLKR